MASYSVNERGVERARALIEARQYVLDSEWGDVQPGAADENAFLESHSWDEYAEWHLGLTEGATDETKARYAFVYGDFRLPAAAPSDDEDFVTPYALVSLRWRPGVPGEREELDGWIIAGP